MEEALLKKDLTYCICAFDRPSPSYPGGIVDRATAPNGKSLVMRTSFDTSGLRNWLVVVNPVTTGGSR